jgi:hypothetical protein
MGQYHAVYNAHRKEKFCMGGAKLLEQCDGLTAIAFLYLLTNSNGRGRGDIMVPDSDPELKALQGAWLNCRIVVQGDYAETGDSCYIVESDREYYTDISSTLMRLAELV